MNEFEKKIRNKLLIKQIVQKYCVNEDASSDLFNADDIANAVEGNLPFN